MVVRQYACIANTTGSIPSWLVTSNPVSSTSCHTSIPRHRKDVAGRRRGFASHLETSQRSNDNDTADFTWPDPPKGHTCPTPYQILAMARTDRYSKARFYHLVKKYHPDKGELDMLDSPISTQVRLERYRLVVAAHNILSDPKKRSAYDRFGMGWQGKPEVQSSNKGSKTGPFSPNWEGPIDPIWQNATWEDWERWHAKSRARENGGNKQSPIYLSNTSFIGLVFIIISAGSFMNYDRAKSAGQYFVDQRDAAHDRAAKDLRRVKVEKQTMGNRSDRIEWFVRQRDATNGVAGSDGIALRDEMASRILPQDVCLSEAVAKQESLEGD